VRILQVNDYATGGGAEVLMQRTADLLSQRGHEVRVFTGDGAGLTRTAWTYVANRAACRGLRRVLDEFRPDVVHFHNVYHLLSPTVLAEAGAWKRASGGKGRIILTAHDYHMVCPNSGLSEYAGDDMRVADTTRMKRLGHVMTRRWDRRGWVHSWFKVAQHVWAYRVRHMERALDLVIAPSRYLCSLLKARGLRAAWIPNPAPASNGLAPPRIQHVAGGSLSLVFAGRVEPEKGLAEFVGALPDAFSGRLTIVGDGSDVHRVRRAIEAGPHRDRIALIGPLPHEATMKVIGDAHVLVMPSLWVENSPLALVEALAMGTNILVADVPPLREIVADAGTGEWFKPRDAAGLAAALDRLQQQHVAGTLNTFDAGRFIASRSEQAYIECIEAAYRGESLVPLISTHSCSAGHPT